MENVNMIDLTALLEALIGVLVLAAMRYLIPWLKEKLTNEQELRLMTVFEIAVLAAEKLYGAKNGYAKLKYVEDYLEKRGIRVDTMRLMTYVNAAIKKMEQQKAGGVTIIENITGSAEPDEEEEEETQTEA